MSTRHEPRKIDPIFGPTESDSESKRKPPVSRGRLAPDIMGAGGTGIEPATCGFGDRPNDLCIDFPAASAGFFLTD